MNMGIVVFVSVAIGVSAPVVAAASSTSFEAVATGLGGGVNQGETAALAEGYINDPENARSGGAFASSSAGQGLKAGADATVGTYEVEDPSNPDIRSTSMGAKATYRFHDVVFTDALNPGTIGNIDVSLNFWLDGFLSVSQGTELDNSTARAGLIVDFALGGLGINSIGHLSLVRDRGQTSLSANGHLFHGMTMSSVSQVFQTPDISVPLNTPLFFHLSINSSASAVSRVGSPVSAISDFQDTLLLNPNGPVFDLPTGFTANSATGKIVDNLVRVAPVPLPAALPMTLLALGSLAALRRRDMGPA